MRISSKTHYAMKTLTDLALHQGEGVCRIADIARRQGVPPKFLEQILLILKGGGIVASKRGIKGGYYLNAAPTEITTAEVLRLTGGQLSPPDTNPSQEQNDSCESALQEVWTDLGAHVADRLGSITLQDLCDRVDKLAGETGTNYII